MNERGFVTIFALCLILVIALVVKGIQESDTNHNYATADLKTEFYLQNAADGGIYEAAEKVRLATENGKELLPANNVPPFRKNYQRELLTRSIKTDSGTITVTVWGERLRIQGYERLYPSYKAKAQGTVKYGYALFSLAELDGGRSGKMYRRAFAYVVDGYGTEYFYRKYSGKNGYKNVEPTFDLKETELPGEWINGLYYVDDLDKFFFYVEPTVKDVVHFVELPAGKNN